MYRALVVDDEEDILELLQYNLEKEGFIVQTAADGVKAVKLAKTFQPDLILLDIMMPEQDGVETCRQMREISETKNAYIIFLTARSEEYSEVAAFEAGADDYITKPVKPRALASRIQAMFRREAKKNEETPVITVGGLEINRNSYQAVVNGNVMYLPKKEFELLYFFASHPNRVFSREELLEQIWGADVYVLARTVDVHVRKLREKIGEGYIVTIKGIGYKFEA